MQAKGDDRVGFLIVPLIFLPPSFPPSLPFPTYVRVQRCGASTPSPPAAGDDCRNF